MISNFDYDQVSEMGIGDQVDFLLLRVKELQHFAIEISRALQTQDQVNQALLDSIKQLNLKNKGIR